MRERIRDKERLVHMLTAIDNLIDGSKRYTVEQAEKDSIIFFGFVKQLEIIGEATYKLTMEFREAHPEVKWRDMAGFRDVLIHGYFEVDETQLWKGAKEFAPDAIAEIEKMPEYQRARKDDAEL